jgi:SPP1 gp7 family putative phage head morphogenesis protein
MPVRPCLVDGLPAWRWGHSGAPVPWGGATGRTSGQAAAMVSQRAHRIAARRLAADLAISPRVPTGRTDARRTARAQHRSRYSDRVIAAHEQLLHARLELAERLFLDLAGPAIARVQRELDAHRAALPGRRDAGDEGVYQILAVLFAVREALRRTSAEEGVRFVGEKVEDDVTDTTDRELSRLYTIPLASAAGSDAIVEGWVQDNVRLIGGLEGNALDDMERMVLEAMRSGKPTLDLRDDIQKRFGVHRNYASFLARDQTAKVAAQIRETQHTKYGITEYVWSTVGDSRVRQDHAELDGTIQKYAEPPIADQRSGKRGHPGEIWQCRCDGIAVLPDADRAAIVAAAEARKERELFLLQMSPTVQGEIPNYSGFSDWNRARINKLRAGVRSAVGL